MSPKPGAPVGGEFPGGGGLRPDQPKDGSSNGYSHDPLILGNRGPGQSRQGVDDL